MGSRPMCETGTSGRSVYQMKTSREQALGEGNCVRVTERGKEACEDVCKRWFCTNFATQTLLTVDQRLSSREWLGESL
jgi:hypothetical protein